MPDYPQLGSTAALVLGLDSVTGGKIIRTMNAVNALIGKPLITKEVINYNKKSTDNFAERYKMAQAVGVGAIIYAAVAGATEAVIMKAALEEQIAKFGDTFGKMGEYVKNPGIKVDWSQYAEHGYERLAQRGMSKELVESIVKDGKALSQNGGAKFAYVTKEGVVVISKEGKLITAWSNSYFDDAMKEIIKGLFGK